MLIISRRKGQRILIGDDIEITVTEVHRSSVKLGIRAPQRLLAIRAELAETYDAEHDQGEEWSPDDDETEC